MDNIKLNQLYRKLELYLYRLFCITEILESYIRGKTIGEPDEILEIFDPKGYNSDYIYIPINPFYDNKKDQQIFETAYPKNIEISTREKDIKKAFEEVWHRINEIRAWIGITEHMRYVGERNAENRLLVTLERYVKNYENGQGSSMTFQNQLESRIIINSDIKKLKKFAGFLKKRKRFTDVQALW